VQPSRRSRIVHHRLLDVSQTTGTGVSSTSPSTPVDDGPAEAATPAVPSQPAVELLVVGAAAGLDALADHLPGSWRVRQVPAGSTGADVDIVLLVGEGVDAVSEVRQRHPGTLVVAAVTQDAPASTVVSILQAGAAACVRISGQHDSAVLVAAHLRLCSRYRTSCRAAGQPGDPVAHVKPAATSSQ